MNSGDGASLALVLATAAHMGFQLTVTVVVYPALARLGAERWQAGHDAHGRAITPLVVLTYGALVLAGGWTLVERPQDPFVLVSVTAAATAVLVTVLVAAPTHARLAAGPDPDLIRRLLVSDRVRAVAAVVAVAAAVAAAL